MKISYTLGMNSICILLLLLTSQTVVAHTLHKFMVNDPGALCLDGTKPAYYAIQGDPQKFVLSFEGGGWCGSAAGIPQTI